MNTKLQLISLTLTNISDIDSEVNLLANPSGANNSAFDTYYKLAFQFTTDGFLFRYIISGITYDYYPSIYSTIDDLVLDLNNEFSSYAIFGYEINGSAPNYYLTIKILDSNFLPYSLQNLIP